MQIPTIPLNVNLIDFTYDIADDSNVVHIKITSASHKYKELEGESSNSQQKKKANENNLEDRPRKKHL